MGFLKKIYGAVDSLAFGGMLPGGVQPGTPRIGGAVQSLTRGPAPPPPLPPMMGFGPQGPSRQPQGGARGVIRRVLPGGRSGYEFDPYDLPQEATDKYGRPLAVHAELVERTKCPPGYVAVDLDFDGVNDACMLKGPARTAGLWTPRPKPPVSGTDARAIRRAVQAQGRVKRLAQGVGFKVSLTKGGGRFK